MTHYDTLHVPSNATPEQIKKQFRKLSLECHPDRPGGNSSIFQKINEAYEILSDPSKRTGYDSPMDLPNDFMDLFAKDIFSFQVLLPPIELDIKITLEQAYSGGAVPIQVSRMHQGRHESETCYVDIPKGIDEEIITLKGKGHCEMGHQGDVRVKVHILPHTLERNGLDLIYTHKVSLKDALCGSIFEIPYLFEKKIKINQEDMVVSPYYKKVVPNMGLKRDTCCGNLILQFHVVFPTTMNASQKELIKQALEKPLL